MNLSSLAAIALICVAASFPPTPPMKAKTITLSSPKGKEQLVAVRALVVVPVVKTNRMILSWTQPDEYHLRIAWKSNGVVVLQTNYTIVQCKPTLSGAWAQAFVTAATNRYVWKGTNSSMVFRLTSAWM